MKAPIEGNYASAGAAFDVARMLTLAIFVSLIGLVIALPMIFGARALQTLTPYLAFRQDLPLTIVFIAAALLRPKLGDVADWIRSSRALLWFSVATILIIGWAGHYLVFQGAIVSRDEQMAIFDQDIFGNGAALWPIPPEWRGMADALGRRFMLPIGANEYWVSGYLPVHSASRALLSLIIDPALTSPLFSAIAVVCAWALARRLWPQSENVAILAIILLVTSSQVMITSMTAFSMSMHLALNLLWLLLFLKDRWLTHLGAVIVGFFATGIHQPLFHPLFAFPFCALLIVQRRWRLAAFYAAVYALIAAFWMWWPVWIVSHGVGPTIPIGCTRANCVSEVSFVERLLALFGDDTVNISNVWVTSANLLRFIVWQHPLLLPLALFGTITCWRSEPLVKALAVSFLLPIILAAIILPWQGHGWGYRYVHPVLGNAVLLAGFGLHRLQQNGLSFGRPFAITTALAVALLPVHAWMAARVAKPYADIGEQLAAVPADIVIVDTTKVTLGQDVVINRFDLSNRPKMLIAPLLMPEDIPKLCTMGTIAFFDRSRLAALPRLYGVKPRTEPSDELRKLRAAAAAAGCRVR